MSAVPMPSLRDSEFPWSGDHIYLNHASVGPIPVRTQRAIDAIERKRRNPALFDDLELPAVLAAGRAAAARLIGADVGEIALAPNTSYGLNTAAQALPLTAGDVVLVPDGEFPANVYPWLLRKRHAVHVELIPRTPDGFPDEDRMVERLRDPRVRAVAVSFVQFATGHRADLDRIGAACREHDAFLVVDAIQGLGQCPLDVRRTPVDVLACGAQKWLLGPWGSGFLYVRRERLGDLDPSFVGWMAFEGTDDFTRLTQYDPTFRADARRFELVTLPFQDIAGMTASLDLLLEIGIERIARHLRGLRAPLLAAAENARFSVLSPTDPVHDSGIWCVRTPDLGTTYRRLRAAGVVASLREGSIRLSPHVYNTADEIARVIEVMAEA